MFFARENLNRKSLRMATKQQPSQIEPLHPGSPKRQHTPNPDTASRIATQLHTAHHFKYPHLMLGIRDVLNTLVLLGSLLIIAALSFETFYDTHGYYFHLYLKIQLWVCIVFMADFFYRLYLSEHKRRFLWHNFIFLLVSIPFLNIAKYSPGTFPDEAYYLLRLMPLVRGGYGLAIMVGWLTRNRITNLMVSYVVSLLALIYFSTLIFFQLERGVNPAVVDYKTAIWWAFMNVTTVGANVFAVTPLGKILTVVLASAGMMVFPIFTVFITNKFQSHIKAQMQHHERTGHEGSPDTSDEETSGNSDSTVETSAPSTVSGSNQNQ